MYAHIERDNMMDDMDADTFGQLVEDRGRDVQDRFADLADDGYDYADDVAYEGTEHPEFDQ